MGRLPEGRQEAACKKDLKPRPFLHSMVQSNIIEWCKRIKKPVLSRLPATKKLFIFCGIFGVGESKKAFPYFGIFGEVRPAEKAPGFWAQLYAGNPPTFTVYIIPLRWGTPGHAATSAGDPAPATDQTGRPAKGRSAVDFTRSTTGTARTQGAGANKRGAGRGDTGSRRSICANSAQLYEKAHFSAGKQATNLDKIKKVYKF